MQITSDQDRVPRARRPRRRRRRRGEEDGSGGECNIGRSREGDEEDEMKQRRRGGGGGGGGRKATRTCVRMGEEQRACARVYVYQGRLAPL